MKGIDIFCTSQASTAICLSMDQATSSCISSNTIQLGSRAIDRHNPIITHSSRFPSTDPKKSSSSNPKDQNKTSSTKGHHQKKKCRAGKLSEEVNTNYSSNPTHSILRRSWVRPPPAGSSRYLLSDAAFLDNLSSEYDSVLALPSTDNQKAQVGHRDEAETKPDSSKSSVSSDQVVVLRVSLHCKGCEGKVRKHLSRMEGVSSFNIDFAAKKVTIVGDVTPQSVLQSVSKVKNAQFWPASASAVGSGIAETKKTNLI